MFLEDFCIQGHKIACSKSNYIWWVTVNTDFGHSWEEMAMVFASDFTTREDHCRIDSPPTKYRYSPSYILYSAYLSLAGKWWFFSISIRLDCLTTVQNIVFFHMTHAHSYYIGSLHHIIRIYKWTRTVKCLNTPRISLTSTSSSTDQNVMQGSYSPIIIQTIM